MVHQVYLVFLFLGLTWSVAHARDNGLGKTPGLGWNSDYCMNCVAPSGENGFEYEAFVKHLATTLSLPPWKGLGYRYVNMDSEWDLPERDSNGNLQPDPSKWPNGIENTIEFVHNLGFGFGLYGDRGTKDCNNNPGQLGHETQDADFLASIKVDWWKSDSCSASGDHATALAEYSKMGQALNATGRPIWYALCGWQPWYAAVGMKIANSWRIGPDTVCGWQCVMENINNALPLANYSGPTAHGGGHNDLCLLLLPGWQKGKAGEMTNDRHRSQFAVWSVLGANMLLTGNLSSIPAYAVETWTNTELIAVNQDPAGLPYLQLTPQSPSPADVVGDPLAMVQECGGEPELQQWDLTTPLAHYVHNNKSNLCLNVADCNSQLIYDGCVEHAGCAASHPFNNEQFNITADGQLVGLLRSDNNCATVSSSGAVTLTACASPVPDSQKWEYDSATFQLKATSSGHCLTAPGGPPPSASATLILARPQGDGSVAAVFLNNKLNATTITCGETCFAEMGFTSGDILIVRDLWQHKDIDTVTAGSSYAVSVDASGASRSLSFRKK